MTFPRMIPVEKVIHQNSPSRTNLGRDSTQFTDNHHDLMSARGRNKNFAMTSRHSNNRKILSRRLSLRAHGTINNIVRGVSIANIFQ